MRWLSRTSRWLHKYVGLVLVLFAIWMSGSGILLNHPDLIRDVSVPGWLVPPQYRIDNWNRGTLRTAVFSTRDPRVGYFAGTQGVWKTVDGGRSFAPMADGFPRSAIDRQTSSLLLDEARGRLYAGTRGGLLACEPEDGAWRSVVLPVAEPEVRKILRVRDDLLVLTPSHVLRGELEAGARDLVPVTLTTAVEDDGSVPLVQACFELHSGKIWGLAGRLLFDAVGVVIVFLGVTAVYIWYWPWKVRRAARRGNATGGTNAAYRWMLKYHLKLGIWLAGFLLVVGGTGFFMRPPMLALLAMGELPRWLYPGRLPENPWHERMQSALYDAVEDKVLIETIDGFWVTSSDLRRPLEPIAPPGPVFVMGTTVFEPYGEGGYLVGSFGGLFHLERATGAAVDLVEGRDEREVSRFRPADIMAAGFLRTPDGEEFVAAHQQGLLPLGGARLDGRFAMPAAMKDAYGFPLWNFLFELHNGRIFRDLIGPWYALIAPLGSLLFVLLTLTGVYDWCVVRFARRRTAAATPAGGSSNE